MDISFLTGAAATISAALIFIGSAFLLLMLVVGPRLAYLITASITLAFWLILSVVWSINPLGPVGQLPEWDSLAAATEAADIEEVDAASDYPEGGWEAPAEGDDQAAAQASELESAATEYITVQAQEGKLEGFPTIVDSPTPVEDSTLFLEQGDTRYGATTIETTTEDGDTVEAVYVAEYDPGNPLGFARLMTLVTFILLVVHLFLLSRAERDIRRRREEVQPA